MYSPALSGFSFPFMSSSTNKLINYSRSLAVVHSSNIPSITPCSFCDGVYHKKSLVAAVHKACSAHSLGVTYLMGVVSSDLKVTVSPRAPDLLNCTGNSLIWHLKNIYVIVVSRTLFLIVKDLDNAPIYQKNYGRSSAVLALCRTSHVSLSSCQWSVATQKCQSNGVVRASPALHLSHHHW